MESELKCHSGGSGSLQGMSGAEMRNRDGRFESDEGPSCNVFMLSIPDFDVVTSFNMLFRSACGEMQTL